jgi:hypothetical protein
MAECKHTAGPWQSEWPDCGDHRYVASTVSTVCDETAVCTPRADQEADARLIAAALVKAVEAVEFCRRVDAGEIRSTRTYAAFKAIIAKAEGSSHD